MKKSMKVKLTFLLFVALTTIITFSCKKDKEEEVKPNPTISFNTDAGYTFASVTTHYGDTLQIGIKGKSNGSDNLTKFKLTANGQTMLDSTINVAEFNAIFKISKSLSDKESWVFTFTDATGKSAKDSIVMTRTREINTFSSIIIGAQSNLTYGGFYSTSNNNVYTMDNAYSNQSLIDFLCFYESNSNKTALASAGAGITNIFTGAHAPENWTIKNTTMYVKTTLTANEFDAVTNDDAIIPNYIATNAFRKAKNLVIGDVYCFLTQKGNFGLLKVTAVSPEADGFAEFAIKIQK